MTPPVTAAAMPTLKRSWRVKKVFCTCALSPGERVVDCVETKLDSCASDGAAGAKSASRIANNLRIGMVVLVTVLDARPCPCAHGHVRLGGDRRQNPGHTYPRLLILGFVGRRLWDAADRCRSRDGLRGAAIQLEALRRGVLPIARNRRKAAAFAIRLEGQPALPHVAVEDGTGARRRAPDHPRCTAGIGELAVRHLP